jgi:xylan 1,4-beta-xylosidase
MMEAQEIQPLTTDVQVHDPGLGHLQLQPELSQQRPQPLQGGFGLLTLQGVAKPSYRAFELLHRLGVDALPVKGKHRTVNVWVVRGQDTIMVLVSNHALPEHPIKAESVHIQLTKLPRSPRNVHIERIDDQHANAKRLWIEMGKPALPTRREVEQLHVASQIVREPLSWQYEAGTLQLKMTMPPQAIAAITLELPPNQIRRNL